MYQLVGDGPYGVSGGEQTALGGHLREKHTFKNVVANFFLKGRHVPALDGIDDFVRFLENVVRQRLECLLPIPRTPFRRAERPHHRHELFKLFACVCHPQYPSRLFAFCL